MHNQNQLGYHHYGYPNTMTPPPPAINQPPKPSKQHFIFDYMIKDDTYELHQTDHNVYSLTFKYVSGSPLVCSVFTFAEDSFNIETATTESLKPHEKFGNEKHIQLAKGEGKEAKIDGLKVASEENYNYTTNIVNCYYPLLIRLVGQHSNHRKTNPTK